MTLTKRAEKELILAQEAFEQGYYAMGRQHLARALFNLRESNYLTSFIGPRTPQNILAF